MSRSPETSKLSESAADEPSDRAPQPSDHASPPETPPESQSDAQPDNPPGKQPLNPVVFFVSAAIITVVALAAIFAPQVVNDAFGAAVPWTSR